MAHCKCPSWKIPRARKKALKYGDLGSFTCRSFGGAWGPVSATTGAAANTHWRYPKPGEPRESTVTNLAGGEYLNNDVGGCSLPATSKGIFRICLDCMILATDRLPRRNWGSPANGRLDQMARYKEPGWPFQQGMATAADGSFPHIVSLNQRHAMPVGGEGARTSDQTALKTRVKRAIRHC